MQEKLNELLAGERKSPGFEELVIPSQSKLVGAAAADSGSNSSWTMLNGKEKDVELRSVHENESVSSFNALEHENEDLVAKISELQRSNWELQERIQLLEEGNAVLAEDLVNKSAIIEQYVKDKAGKKTKLIKHEFGAMEGGGWKRGRTREGVLPFNSFNLTSLLYV